MNTWQHLPPYMLNYFGHGVILLSTSSMANVRPLTIKALPIPFHNTVMLCLWCNLMTTGTKLKGSVWYFVENTLT